MFRNVFTFELRYRLRQPSTYIYFGILFLIGFLFLAVEETFFGPSTGGKVFKNAPDTLANFHLGGSFLALFITAAIMGTPIYRDDKEGITGLLYTTPLRKSAYLGGRFLASLLIIWFIMSGMSLGAMAGSVMPWLNPAKYGPFRLDAYLGPLLGGAFVNAFFAGCVFFAAYALTRSSLVVYLGGIVLFLLYQISLVVTTNLSNERLAALLDPFGLDTRTVVTKYWSIAERNTKLLPFGSGAMLENRLLWVGVGLALLALSFATFRMAAPRSRGRAAAPEAAPLALAGVGIRRSPVVFGPGTALWQLGQLARVQFLNVVRAKPFMALVFFGVVNVLFSAYFRYTGERVQLPVTYEVLSLVNNGFGLFVLIIITVYSGELVWRERETKLQQVFDALPLPNWVPFVSKLLALIGTQVVLYAALVGVGLGIQLFRGYHHLELGLYGKDFLLQLLNIVQLCALTMAVQTIVNNKYVGYTVMILFYVVVYIAPDALGVHHVLLKYDGTVPYTYSDMNGYGHFVAPLFWLNLYYMAGALLLAVLTNLLWVRGAETSLHQRGRLFGQRFGLGARLALGGAALAAVLVGGYVYYNTNVLNEYFAPKGLEARAARAERQYKRYEYLAQPKIIATKLAMNIFPTASPRHYQMQAALMLLNKESRPLDTLFVNYNPSRAVQTTLTPGRPATVLLDDPVAGVRLYRLARPLAPGDSLPLAVRVSYAARGFSSRPQDQGVFSWATISPEDRLTANGTFLDGTGIRIGYQPDGELEEDDVRQRNQLKPKERVPRLNDPRGLMTCGFTNDADYARFEATVSTDPDQTAIVPGYLQKEWVANGRRYFHYRMDAPMLNFYSIQSARYAVRRDQWQDPATGQKVAIEIYYHPAHAYNVPRMADALKKGLTYYTREFGPYQYRQVRIQEFPRYKNFAQSFPNTIPTSEGAGFITDLRKASRPDNVFFITNHELGHQWWGHQVVGGQVQGSSMLSESLAEYSALMVCQHEFTAPQMQKTMRAELERYLRGRRDERKKELPLMLVENQPYIHYFKGGMVFYALQDYIGEEKLNGAIKAFLAKTRYQTRPYTNTAEFMTYLRKATPDSMQYLLHDMFETITLFENQLDEATYTKRSDGKYDVRLTIRAAKTRADSLGNETPLPLRDYVDVGIFGPDQVAKTEDYDASGRPLFFQKVKLTQPVTVLNFVVAEKPAKAGVDPYHKLIDRHYQDNVKAVTAGAAPALAVR
ncbi:ABC transporter permease/M1 family aminopeptidase [Hymenobacter psoromatis]|uniref:ABC transporter permease/M1 family aminopeptidase n=1 Tax=Hymenobacter psoromatis TaxID=1484116 RepID=UPI001CC1954C|nr:M1 family aminopeptidase [Hymenobacter psoromatis]